MTSFPRAEIPFGSAANGMRRTEYRSPPIKNKVCSLHFNLIRFSQTEHRNPWKNRKRCFDSTNLSYVPNFLLNPKGIHFHSKMDPWRYSLTCMFTELKLSTFLETYFLSKAIGLWDNYSWYNNRQCEIYPMQADIHPSSLTHHLIINSVLWIRQIQK